MAADNGNADAGHGDIQIGQMHDLAALELELHFLAGVAVHLLAADLGDQIVSDLMREDLGCVGFALLQCFHFVHQLDGTACTGTGNCLIGRNDHALDGSDLVQCVNGSAGDDGGAVGVGDDALMVLSVLGVDFGNDQGNIGIQTESGGVVNKDSTGFHDRGSPLFSDIIFSSAQNDVNALESFCTDFLDGHFFTLEGDLLACGTGGCQRHQLADREIAFCQNVHHFLANGAGCAQNGNGIEFHSHYLQIIGHSEF